MNIKEPKKLEFAMLPTPLERLEQTSKDLGVSLWVKRDDLTGSAESGNKIRKLEYLAADAASHNANVLITCGGEQSNHCRATAIVARKLGMAIHLVLRRTAEGPTGNFLLDMILGASIRWVSPDEYINRDEIMDEEAEKLRALGLKPYIVPEGGSNSIGVWGYFSAAKEILGQAQSFGFSPDYVITATGSGGTYAGLWLGFKALGASIKIIGITSGADIEQQKAHIWKISNDFVQRYAPHIGIEASEINLIDGFWRGGYGIIDEELAMFICQFAQKEGLILDPVYTAKAFLGAFTMLRDGRLPKDKNIILLHTGGIFGLFPKGQFFRELFFGGGRAK